MMTFDVNKNNDIHLGNSGNLAIANGERSLKNRCEHYVKAIRGEMLHKLDRGFLIGKRHLDARLIFRSLNPRFGIVCVNSMM